MLAASARRYYWGGSYYWYDDGSWWEPYYYEDEVEYVQVYPEEGLLLDELPEGAEEVVIDGETYYHYNGYWYKQVGLNVVWAITACYGVGFVVLGLLPTIERMFDITTGMTLAELRDPRQPLLRQLQQKAPGTYNHSLQVANIAEAAADAIGADSLHLYVGALYHDIGKMSKPEYFIENQTSGPSKHDKCRFPSPVDSVLLLDVIEIIPITIKARNSINEVQEWTK